MMRRVQSHCGSSRHRQGILLMECLAYMSLWLIVVGVALQFFYQAYTQSKHLVRNADDIVRVLKAGERWRTDVRSSSLAPRWEPRENEAGRDLVLGAASDWVAYRCTTTNVLRRSAGEPRWKEVFGGLQVGAFHRDERGSVVSWRWELELRPRVQKPGIRPRFTFQAVPSVAQQQ